jgi:nicotinate-nucleotide adenylyltransferase
MTDASRRLGLLGGTLDPIHLGHLESARAARAALGLDRVIIVPSRVPPHRHQQPQASPYHRFAMAALAVNGAEGLSVSDMELSAPGPSYTADTLTRLRANGAAPSQLFFITGADAFAEIATWHRYPEVLDLAHFVVIARPGHDLEAVRERLPRLAGRMIDAARMPSTPGGCGIYLVAARTPDVSSTEVRQRIARGEPPTGLVPAAVEAHIMQHGLYRAGQLHGED